MHLQLTSLVVLTASFTSFVTANNACDKLKTLFPKDVAFPGSAAYNTSHTYWSDRQSDLNPYCFVTPRTTKAVSTIIKTLTSTQTRFSVKSGGHTSFEGSSSVDKGVTIDLVNLNQVTLSSNKKIASIGPGNRWIDVANVLDKEGVAVVGGRMGSVGVGGLLLGGGISWFSGLYGFACDRVAAFEVVLSSGEVVTASSKEHSDLYWALRGGGSSNFGVVTRFDLFTHKQGNLWTQSLYFPGAMNASIIPPYIEMVKKDLAKNVEAHSWLVTGWEPSVNMYIVFPYFSLATPPSPEGSIPKMLEPFQSIPNAFQNVTLTANTSTHLSALVDTSTGRRTWYNTAVKLTSTELFHEIETLYYATNEKLISLADSGSISSTLDFQPITTNILKAMAANGGNALGLRPSDGPYMQISLQPKWNDPSLDAAVEKTAADFISGVQKLASKRGASATGYIYMNYATTKQDVLRSYGAASYARLQRVAQKYDPKQLLPKFWRGSFQLKSGY